MLGIARTLLLGLGLALAPGGGLAATRDDGRTHLVDEAGSLAAEDGFLLDRPLHQPATSR